MNLNKHEAVYIPHEDGTEHYLVNLGSSPNVHIYDGITLRDKNEILIENPDKLYELVDTSITTDVYHSYIVEGKEYLIDSTYYRELNSIYYNPEMFDVSCNDKYINHILTTAKPYETKKVKTTKIIPVKLNIVGTLQDTGSDFIHSALQVGKKQWFSYGMFKVDSGVSIAKDELEILLDVDKIQGRFPKLSYEGVELDFSEYYPSKFDHGVRYFDAIDKAKEYEDNIRKIIEDIVMSKEI